MIIGLEVRHFKAYKNQNFIPIGHEHNFVAFSGENGVGKSSILEALDTFLNNKEWLVTKNEKENDAYICPLFLVPKPKVTKLNAQFEIISKFFWNYDQKDKRDRFFEIRDTLKKDKLEETHYLIFLGESHDRTIKVPFGESAKKVFDDELKEAKFSEKLFLRTIKDIYSYVYIPVEINSQEFTKIETIEMQKIFNREVKNEIKKSLRQKDIDTINTKLNGFVKELEIKLEDKYFYDTGDTGIKKLTQNSLIDTILISFFKKRVLMKGGRGQTKLSKKMSELSAGEKREALINLVYVFLREEDKRDSIIIVGIDEPENSLHTSICYEQFEKLKKVSKNAQVLITTHWYGFLPIVDKGMVHFLENTENPKGEMVITFQTVDLFLYPYQTKNIPKDFSLKSTNDLIQSIFHSLKALNPYNWLICEGVSDQIYLECFLKKEIEEKNLRIIPVGGIELVKKFYKYLSLPIEEHIKDLKKGKVFCLTDTDKDLRKKGIEQVDDLKNNLIIKRLAKSEIHLTTLIKFETEANQDSIDIEKSLNPIIFQRTLEVLQVEEKFLIKIEDIQNSEGNTSKENLRNFDIDDYFTNEDIKNTFAMKYVEVMGAEGDPQAFSPGWVKDIKLFFNKEAQ